MDWQAISLTARLAALVSIILLVISLPLAHWLTFSRRRWTFLIESVVLGLTGGAVGIVAGVGISLLMSGVFNWPTLISPLAVVTSAVFSMAIGVFFGYYPARRAAALDPIEALRFE